VFVLLLLLQAEQLEHWQRNRRQLAFSTVGTPDYIAPEVRLGSITLYIAAGLQQRDFWEGSLHCSVVGRQAYWHVRVCACKHVWVGVHL
jgi:serine/threonine protein kinase